MAFPHKRICIIKVEEMFNLRFRYSYLFSYLSTYVRKTELQLQQTLQLRKRLSWQQNFLETLILVTLGYITNLFPGTSNNKQE